MRQATSARPHPLFKSLASIDKNASSPTASDIDLRFGIAYDLFGDWKTASR